MTTEKLPSSFRAENRTTRQFREQVAAKNVLEITRKAAMLFHRNPAHPSLRHHRLKDTVKGRHEPESYSVSVTMQYRAIYVVRAGINVWYWIGTHAEYDVFVGSV